MNEDSSKWNVSSGALNISPKTGNLFLQYAPLDDWEIETKSNCACPSLGDTAYLMMFQDQSNYLKFMRINRFGLKIEMEKLSNGVSEIFSINDPLSGDYYFRIVKTGDLYDPFYSDDGTNWTALNGGYDISFDKQLQLGIGAQSPFGTDPAFASFDYFTIDITNPASIGVDDEFTSPQIDRDLWLIHNENPGHWSLSGGALEIQTEEGNVWRFRRNARNLFLQKAPDGDFAIKTKVMVTPEMNYEQAMLLVWSDHNNYIKLSTLYDNGLKFEAASESGGDYSSYFMENTIGGAVYLKIGFGAMSPESWQARTASFDFFRVEKSPPIPTPNPTPTRIPLKFMLLY